MAVLWRYGGISCGINSDVLKSRNHISSRFPSAISSQVVLSNIIPQHWKPCLFRSPASHPKVLEHNIYSSVFSFLEANSCLFQHELRKNVQGEPQLVYLIHDLTSNMDNQFQAVIFLDFSKASGTVTHSCLVINLSKLNLSFHVYIRIHTFLTNYLQSCFTKNSLYNFCLVTSGALQGSILAPLFFLLFRCSSLCR